MKQYPWYPTIYYDEFAAFVDGMAQYGDKPAVSAFDRQGSETVRSFRQLHADVTALQRTLVSRGLSGRHTAIVGENSYGWIVAFLAVVSCGGVAVCIDIEQPDQAISQMLAQADTGLVFASDSMLELCRSLTREISDCAGVFSLEDELVSLIAEGEHLPEPAFQALEKDQPAAIVFTSGTTALPKAVVLTNGNLLSNAASAVAALDQGETFFTGLPFFHAYGLTCGILCALLRGTHLTINGDLRTMIRDLSLSDAVTILTVPLILEVLWKHARGILEAQGKWQEAERIIKRCTSFGKPALAMSKAAREQLHDLCFGTLRTVICGGAHMNTEISNAMEILGICVLQGYGITECSPLIAVNRNRFHSPDTVGTLLPGWELKFENGEIMMKGPGLMAGYYKDPEATEAAVTDGWFHTGDLGMRNDDGQLCILGRVKNLIVLKNGKKISPERIEEMILRIPLVKDAVVYGSLSGAVADDVKPAVSIYPDPEQCGGMERYEILNLIQEKINDINASLPTYQQIQMISIRDKEFEKNASHKTIRSVNETEGETISL